MLNLSNAPSSKISDISFEECLDSAYIKPKRMRYVENGINRCWDFIKSYDSVSIFLYHRELDSALFVKQFRPPLYVRNNHGYAYELCAGLVDKNKSLEQIAIEEVYEECGYEVKNLRQIGKFATAVGHSGATQSIFYAEITESNKISNGGGVDGEVIECVFVKKEDLLEFLNDEKFVKTPGLAYGVMWFLSNIK